MHWWDLNVNGKKFWKLTQDCFLTQHVHTPTRSGNIFDLVLSTEREGIVDEVKIDGCIANSNHNVITWRFHSGELAKRDKKN